MKDNDPRTGRLVKLARMVRFEPFLTRQELAERLRITERQFYNDRNTLAACGFEFQWDRRKERHSISRDELLGEGTSLSYLEAVALGCAVMGLHKGGEPNLAAVAKSGLEKLLDAATRESSQTNTIRDLLGQVPPSDPSKLLSGAPPAFVESFARGLAERRVLLIDYESLKRETKEHKLQIYGLFVAGLDGLSLYADAWDVEDKQYKVFRLSRVRSCTLGKSFRPRTDYSFAQRHRHVWQVWSAGQEPTEVTIHVCDGPQSGVIRERVQDRMDIIDRADGSFDMSCKVTSINELVWWTLLWTGAAYVTGPPSAVKVARESVESLRQAYEV